MVLQTDAKVSDSDRQKATKTIDHMIDDVTTPMLKPVLAMSAIEGAPFLSSFKNSTPWAIEAQKYVAGELAGKYDTEFVDAYKTMEYGIEGQFAHAKPVIH